MAHRDLCVSTDAKSVSFRHGPPSKRYFVWIWFLEEPFPGGAGASRAEPPQTGAGLRSLRASVGGEITEGESVGTPWRLLPWSQDRNTNQMRGARGGGGATSLLLFCICVYSPEVSIRRGCQVVHNADAHRAGEPDPLRLTLARLKRRRRRSMAPPPGYGGLGGRCPFSRRR